MKVAIVGSRDLFVENLEDYVPMDAEEIISGGASGIDFCAMRYAHKHRIPLTEIRPDYRRYKRGAPLKRNLEIIAKADLVLAFWDGSSTGTKFVIDNCIKQNVPVEVYRITGD